MKTPPTNIKNLIGLEGIVDSGKFKFKVIAYAGSKQRFKNRKPKDSRYLGSNFKKEKSPKMSNGKVYYWWIEINGDKLIHTAKYVKRCIKNLEKLR